MSVTVYTHWTRPDKQCEKGGGGTMVEGTYITTQQQVEQMLLAGQRLMAAREQEFDFESVDKVDFDAVDPTRTGDFDLADASQYRQQLAQRRKVQAAAKAAKNDKGVAVAAQKVSGGELQPEVKEKAPE